MDPAGLRSFGAQLPRSSTRCRWRGGCSAAARTWHGSRPSWGPCCGCAGPRGSKGIGEGGETRYPFLFGLALKGNSRPILGSPVLNPQVGQATWEMKPSHRGLIGGWVVSGSWGSNLALGKRVRARFRIRGLGWFWSEVWCSHTSNVE